MPPNNSQSFAQALIANGSKLPEQVQIFAPFIGDWDLIVRWYDAGGSLTRTEKGEWFFSWVLEGRGIQDVWIVPPREQRSSASLYEYGTSIRFYDPNLDAWQSTWVGPMHQIVRTFTARRIGSDIVLQTKPGISPMMRWSFGNIAMNSFTWINEIEEEGGWRVQQTFDAQRRMA